MKTNSLTNEELEIALKFCRNHLDGAWQNVTLDAINVYRVSGGLTNLLYRCVLKDSLENGEKPHYEPRQVLLRVYGKSSGDMNVQLEIFKQLAAACLGPNLYSSFEEGRFEEYLPSSPLTLFELTDKSISRTVAKKIASIHKLNVQSLEKDANWLINKYNQYNDSIEATRNVPISFQDYHLESTKIIARELMAIDFKTEIEYLKKVFETLKQPLVFSHNDLHQNNIILLHDNEKDLNDRIVLIDFEYSSYNYQTFDVANHLSEWCFDYNSTNEYPHFSASIDRLPNEEKQREFLTNYLESYDKNNGMVSDIRYWVDTTVKGARLELLFNEMQPLFMASNFLWAIWGVESALYSKIKFGYWEFAKHKWEIYLLCKRNQLRRNDDSSINHFKSHSGELLNSLEQSKM